MKSVGYDENEEQKRAKRTQEFLTKRLVKVATGYDTLNRVLYGRWEGEIAPSCSPTYRIKTGVFLSAMPSSESTNVDANSQS